MVQCFLIALRGLRCKICHKSWNRVPVNLRIKSAWLLESLKRLKVLLNAPVFQEVDFMSWLNKIGELAERYGANAAQGGGTTHEDFQRVAQSDRKSVV